MRKINFIVSAMVIATIAMIHLYAQENQELPKEKSIKIDKIEMEASTAMVAEWDQEVFVGDEFSVGDLSWNASTGYHWNELIDYNAGDYPIEYVRTEFDRNNKSEDRPGRPPLPQTAFYKSKKPGSYILRFMHTGPGIQSGIFKFRIIHLLVKSKDKKRTKDITSDPVNYKTYQVKFPAKIIQEINQDLPRSLRNEVVIEGLAAQEGEHWYHLATPKGDGLKFIRRITLFDIGAAKNPSVEFVFKVTARYGVRFIKTGAGIVPSSILQSSWFGFV